MSDTKISKNEKYLASAVHYLMSIGKADMGRLLLTCQMETDEDEQWGCIEITLRGSPEFYNRFSRDIIGLDEIGNEIEGEFRTSLYDAFKAVFPNEPCYRLIAAVGLIEVDLDWRTRLLAESETQEQVSNQNPYVKEPIIWNGIKFASNSPGELAIAKALEKAGVMFLPNCLLRVGVPGRRDTVFPDFLIAYRGKWGILEVDGQTYHKDTATADYERMRKLRPQVTHFDRFPAQRCMNEPDKVVKEFLTILERVK